MLLTVSPIRGPVCEKAGDAEGGGRTSYLLGYRAELCPVLAICVCSGGTEGKQDDTYPLFDYNPHPLVVPYLQANI